MAAVAAGVGLTLVQRAAVDDLARVDVVGHFQPVEDQNHHCRFLMWRAPSRLELHSCIIMPLSAASSKSVLTLRITPLLVMLAGER